jgi:hypothetical protein
MVRIGNLAVNILYGQKFFRIFRIFFELKFHFLYRPAVAIVCNVLDPCFGQTLALATLPNKSFTGGSGQRRGPTRYDLHLMVAAI